MSVIFISSLLIMTTLTGIPGLASGSPTPQQEGLIYALDRQASAMQVQHADHQLYQVILKWRDRQIHRDMLMAPETRELQESQADAAFRHKSATPLHKFNVASTTYRANGLQVLQAVYQQTGIIMQHQRSISLGNDVFLLSTALSAEEAISHLLETGLFEYVTLNTPIRGATESPLPAQDKLIYPTSIDMDLYPDKNYASQYYLDEAAGIAKGNNDLLRASLYAIEHRNLGRRIRVGIVDSGAFPHEDVAFAEGADFVTVQSYADCASADDTFSGEDITCPAADFRPHQRDMDATDKSWLFRQGNDGELCINGHGLKVASVIGATRGNGLGFIGAADDDLLELVPLRVMSCSGGLLSDAADAIVWASGGAVPGIPNIARPVDIINLSLGGEGVECTPASLYYQAIEFARSRGVTVIAAAGNNDENVSTFTPGNCDGALTVASNNQAGDLSLYSNYGDAVEVSFAGDDIAVAYIDEDAYIAPQNSPFCTSAEGAHNRACYSFSSGSSMSVPLATATAAMIKAVKPQLSESEIRALISQTAGFNFTKDVFGRTARRVLKTPYAGIGNAYRAVTEDLELQSISNTEAAHHFIDYNSPAEKIYLNSLIALSGKDNVCNMYRLDWSNYKNEVDSLQYHIYASNTNAALLTEDNATRLSSTDHRPFTVVNLNGFNRVGVQSVVNGRGGDIVEFTLSQAPKPPVCSS